MTAHRAKCGKLCPKVKETEMKKLSIVASKLKSKKLIATVVATVLILGIFTTTVLADSLGRYDVTIVDGAARTTIATAAKEPIDVLKTAGIILNSDDKMDITDFEKGEGGTIVINRLNSVNIKFGDNVQTYNVYAPTVGAAIGEIGLTCAEKSVNYAFGDSVSDGMVIEIKAAPHVTLKVDGKKIKIARVSGKVKDLLKLANVTLGENDYTTPSLDTALKAGMKVTLNRVQYRTVTKNEVIKFDTVKKKDKKLAMGKKKVVTKGKNGSKRVTSEVKIVNGKVTNETVLKEVVLTEPTSKVVKVGTKYVDPTVKPNGVKSMNGFTLGQKIQGSYTRYCMCAICCGVETGVTASGKRVYNGMPDPHYVALNWLPMGSVIKVNGTNYTVVDRGGGGLSAVGKVDVFTPEGHAACYRLGCGSCTIEIVRLGW